MILTRAVQLFQCWSDDGREETVPVHTTDYTKRNPCLEWRPVAADQVGILSHVIEQACTMNI